MSEQLPPLPLPSATDAAAESTLFYPNSAATLAPGTLLANRYRIVRHLARGGMGSVYEAYDLELHEHIALKLIRSEIVSHTDAVQRLKREIQLARRVTHPSVCRLYDLAVHDEPSTGKLTFVTMELLRGMTLGERIRRSAPLVADEAIDITRQLCEGLSAAHASGIIHRDLKPENIMLVPEIWGTRVVITDFGLAWRKEEAGVEIPKTSPGMVIGTLAYMAPEQLSGEPVTPASDLYALGLVMYEMFTGTHPFGTEGLSAAMRRLSEAVASPRELNRDVDPLVARVIVRCLQRDPSDRFAKVSDMVRVLDGSERMPRDVKALWSGATRRWPQIALLAVTLALIVAAFAASQWRRGDFAERRRESGAAGRPAVAVLGFRNLSGDSQSDWLSTAFAEMLATELSAGGTIRAVPGESIARAKRDLGIRNPESLSDETLARLREAIGADVVVAGSYIALPESAGGRIRLDFVLQETGSGETIHSASAEGSQASLFELVSQTGADLRKAIGEPALPASLAGAIRASRPANPEAVRLYAQGLERLRSFDPQGALEVLRAAVRTDPEYALGHSALAAAWMMLGYESEANDAAQHAVRLSGPLVREERLHIEARAHEISRKWKEAAEVYRALFTLFPDQLDYGISLAMAQSAGGDAKGARATIDEMRRLPAVLRDDARIDLTLAAVALSSSDFEGARAAAAEAAKIAKERGNQLMWAQARSAEGNALQRLGRLDEATRALAEATDVFRRAGDLNAAAITVNRMGSVAVSRDDFAAARRHYQDAFEVARRIGNKRAEAIGMNNLAFLLMKEGKIGEAKHHFVQTAAAFEALNQRQFLAGAWDNVGYVEYLQGNVEASEASLTKALEIARESGSRHMEAIALFNLADLNTVQGDIDRARRTHLEALEIRTATKEKKEVIESRLALASLDLERGSRKKALAGAREVLRECDPMTETAILARLLAARCLLAQGDASAAGSEIAEAEKAISKSGAVVRTALEIGRARVRGATRDGAAEAAGELKKIIAEGGARGLVLAQVEARLVAAEVMLRSGRREEARRELEAVRAEARRRGLGLAAERAKAIEEGEF